MSIGIVGRKIGMTRIFTEAGDTIPVTVIEASPNRVTQVKNLSTDQYQSVQITTGTCKVKRVNKSLAGHFAKSNVEAGRLLLEFRVDSSEYKSGDVIDLNVFAEGQKVDVSGRSKGKGFQGGVKRWNFSMLDATHGNSVSHRSNGSIGQCQTPGRVFKGKKMSGHMGDRRVTTQNLEIAKIDIENNLLLVKGAIPGANNSYVEVRPAVKEKSGK